MQATIMYVCGSDSNLLSKKYITDVDVSIFKHQ